MSPKRLVDRRRRWVAADRKRDRAELRRIELAIKKYLESEAAS